MPRLGAAGAAVVAIGLLPGAAVPSGAQEWNDARTTALVSRATERRALQLADTGLTDYTATAIGALTFLAQVGEGFPDPPKVVKADQIALEVYWRAPNHSKQLILGRRDTLLLPTDIQYHRDHLGIVQNNFPRIIRLGDGDEVRDVPHPLSDVGLQAYDFAITDSMRIEIPGQVIEVLEVRLRPKDPSRPAAVGAVYLSRADAQVVRMAFSFTRAALIDQQLEDVSIVLDNALIESRFWLPRRQEIEIRRSGSWLEFPARGIIRGGFEICCYRVNTGQPATRFVGPEIELAPPERRAAYEFPAPLRTVVPPVGQAALARARRATVLAGSLSDLARVNRAEGLSLGAGVRQRLGPVFDVAIAGRYGLSDERLKGSVRMSWRPAPTLAIRAGAFDETRDASDWAEVSGVRNSIGAQEFGADFTEPYRVRGFDVRADAAFAPATVSLGLAREWTEPAVVQAVPASGAYRPAPPVMTGHGWRADARLSLAQRAILGGIAGATVVFQVRRLGEPGSTSFPTRGTLHVNFERPVGDARLRLETFGGTGSSPLAQDLIRAGGPVTGPGYGAHQFVSRALLAQRVEWQFPIHFPGVPLGRWGRSPSRATLAPLATVVLQEERDAHGSRRVAAYPALGTGLLVFFDLVRLDVARGLRDGRWMVGVDLTRDLWRIL